MERLTIYTDGGSRGNPGPAAFGFVIKDAGGKLVRQYGEAIGVATNNEAEYRAVAAALKKAKQMFGSEKLKQMGVEMRMDSQLAVEQLSGRYKIENEKLQPLFIQIWNLRVELGGNVVFTHIPREKNTEADRMVNEALDQKEQDQLF
ncbi:MAG: ribonuclease H [Parcubacteria group bacterium Gr01-1014_29]|nr:MAG: ribonuclease H [Parcubacteria group bacterium Gr01-1014_29]